MFDIQILWYLKYIIIFRKFNHGFDPGPEWTLEFYFTHASQRGFFEPSGVRVSKTVDPN